MYEPRLYRGNMNRERFRFFPSTHLESDLLIGVPYDDFREEMIHTSFDELVRLRNLVTDFAEIHPSFATSLEPIQFSGSGMEDPAGQEIPAEIDTMIRCGINSGTGPMSSVAGMFADRVGQLLIKEYKLKEVVVENGGDLFLNIETEIVSVVHAGDSPLSDKMAFVITPGTWGVCTSSGTLGHSFSKGKADAVTVIAKNTPLADSWATALANRVSTPQDIKPVLEQVKQTEEISGCAIIVGEQVGIQGKFELKLLS